MAVEQDRQRPVELLAAAREHHVLLAPLDQLGGIADAMRGGRAGRRYRIVGALDLEGGGQRRRRPRAHALRHLERADLLGVLLAGDVGGAHDGPRRGSARAHDDAGALVHDIARLEARVADGLVHGDVVPAHARFHEAARLARDHAFPFDVRLAVHLAAEAELGVFLRAHDAGLRFPQRGDHLLGAVSDRGNDPHARHHHASHRTTLSLSPPAASPRMRARASLRRPAAAPWRRLTRPRVVLPPRTVQRADRWRHRSPARPPS